MNAMFLSRGTALGRHTSRYIPYSTQRLRELSEIDYDIGGAFLSSDFDR